MKKIIIFIVVSLVVLTISIGAYKIFFGTHNMDYSIILDKTKSDDGFEVTLYHNGKEKVVTLPESLEVEPAPAYNIKLKNNTIASISPIEYNYGKILSIDDSKIYLEDKELDISDSAKYYKLEGKTITETSNSSIIVGYQGYRFIMDKNNKVKIILCSIPKLNRIRTLISTSDFSTQNHKEIKLVFSDEGEIKSKDINYKFAPKDELLLSNEGDSIKLSLIRGNAATSIGSSSSRIQVIQGESSKLSIPSNARKNGHTPSYYGSFEVFLNDGNMNLINESYLDNYLKGVVPSEMPSSGGVDGYKVQSVVSRTNAIQSILSKEYAKLGVHTLDTEPLYEASNSNPQSNEAVEATTGEIVTSNGEIIDAKFYSTSPGFGSSYEDVFGKVVPTKDYLKSAVFDESNTKLNVSNEENITSYLKDWTAKSHDSNSPFFRWKFSIDYSDVSKVINGNIYDLYVKEPKNFRQKWNLFIYKEANISKDGIGKIQDINVSSRSKTGIISEITITTDKDTFKIKGENILRKILIPKENFQLITIFGSPIKNITSLPSPYFTIEKNMTGDKFKSITIYGGGEGHGVGLSKYGTIGLLRAGKSYQEVITYFYSGTEIVNLNRDFRLEVENRKL